jgi:large subunit ribosomal protein L30e
MSEEIQEIKKLVKEKLLVVGTNNTFKKVIENKIDKVWMSSNVPEKIKNDLMHYKKIDDINVVTLEIPNDELGVICKKPFSVSVVSRVKIS